MLVCVEAHECEEDCIHKKIHTRREDCNSRSCNSKYRKNRLKVKCRRVVNGRWTGYIKIPFEINGRTRTEATKKVLEKLKIILLSPIESDIKVEKYP